MSTIISLRLSGGTEFRGSVLEDIDGGIQPVSRLGIRNFPVQLSKHRIFLRGPRFLELAGHRASMAGHGAAAVSIGL